MVVSFHVMPSQPEPILLRQLPVIQKVIRDETWLEAERRGCPVSAQDPAVRKNVCQVVLPDRAASYANSDRCPASSPSSDSCAPEDRADARSSVEGNVYHHSRIEIWTEPRAVRRVERFPSAHARATREASRRVTEWRNVRGAAHSGRVPIRRAQGAPLQERLCSRNPAS